MNFKRFLPHLIAVVGFAILAIVYCSPVLKGKRLNQHDIIQSIAAGREVVDYHKQAGEWAWWTNSMFGGMPAYMISGDYPTSLTHKLGQYINLLLPDPANYIWLMMVGAYVLLVVLSGNAWISAIGSVAYAFASYQLLSLEAGHVSKILALAYAPGILAGVIMALRGRYLAGAALTALFLGLELYANHVQITYYLAFGIVVYVLIESIVAVREGRMRQLLLALSALAVAAVLAVGTHTTRLWNTADYVTVSTRGKSELTISPKAEPGAPGTNTEDGLGKDYAFQYSYGIGETFTLLIPNYAGGPSAGSLTTNSETYKKLTSIGVDPGMAQQYIQILPLYHGNLYSQSGPAYAGAIVIFLFVLGLFIVPGRLKWWALGIALLYIAWAWGKNAPIINYTFFDYFPGFNKFRAVTMTLTLAQLPLIMLAGLALKQLVDQQRVAAGLNRPLLISLGITAGLSLLMALAPTVFQSFSSPNDGQLLGGLEQALQNKNLAEQVLAAMVEDRIGMVRSDAFRSAILILLVGGLIWLFVRNRLKPAVFYPLVLALVIFDLFGIDKRYFNNDDFVNKQAIQETVSPTPADEQILADKSLDFRVLDLTTSFMSDAKASYFHKSLGGYHAAKMRRYQELADFQLYRNLRESPTAPNAYNVINMLNTRYFITQAQSANPEQQQAPGPPVAVPNPGALGNAWFVQNYRLVPNANAEMQALDSLNTRTSAVIDQRFAEQLKGLTLQADSANSIRLTSYKPNELTYESNAKSEQLAVFSEIYYNVRDEWKVTVDGKEMPHLRANYVLRAMRVPAGKHTIVFQFDPVSIRVGKIVDLVSSLLIIAFIGTAVFIENRKKKG
ncbi:YfhO family protein [Larkinella bovis]|uniref:YfhO family protein n=1 Tax=Larkinella bovis TaxID=683041 RepID=A0ABW0I7U8_9BACT